VTCSGGVIVTLAVAILLASATLVAVTVTVCGPLSAAGAEYRPLLEIVPTAGTTDHVTAVFAGPVTAAANCRVCPVARFAELGDMLTAREGCSTTVATPFRVPSAAATAVTVTVLGWLIVLGAMYCPLADIVPVLTLPSAIPSTAQVSSALVAPVATNCCVPPAWTVTQAGDRLTALRSCITCSGPSSEPATELGLEPLPDRPEGGVWPASDDGTIHEQAKNVRMPPSRLILRIR
jgi:hypothetical protein